MGDGLRAVRAAELGERPDEGRMAGRGELELIGLVGLTISSRSIGSLAIGRHALLVHRTSNSVPKPHKNTLLVLLTASSLVPRSSTEAHLRRSD